MSETMKALVYEGPRRLATRDLAVPRPEEGDVLIRVERAGICGSELSGYLGQNPLRKPPLVMGHELSGTVESLGPGALRYNPDLKAGARVTVNPLVVCGRCRHCLSGRQQLCGERQLIGAHRAGGYAEFVVVPARNVHRLPDTVSAEEGALAEPLACAVHLARLTTAEPGMSVLVVGMGPLGLLTLRMLRARGVERVLAVDRNRHRLRIAREWGAETVGADAQDVGAAISRLTDGRGVDVAVDAVGAGATRRLCLSSCSPGGRIVFAGLHEPESSLPVNDAVRSEISLVGSFAYSAADFADAVLWIAEHRLTVGDWLICEPLERGSEWFDRLLDDPGAVVKVLLVP